MTTDVTAPEMELVLGEDSSNFTLPMIEPGLEAVLSTLRQGDFVAQGGQAQVHRVTKGTVDLAARSVSFREADEQIKRLEREARIIRGLDHPNIVGYRGYEVNTVQKRWGQDIEYTFYMDWIAGPTLKDILQPGEQHRELSGTEVDALFAQVASALSYCHERGILHRDIKPSNLKLTDENCVKLLDFGLVKREGETTMTASEGRFLGTYTYAAPEVRNGKKAEAASDWYSAAVMTVELLAGIPYEGVVDPVDVREKLKKIKHAPPRLRETLDLLLEENPLIRTRNIDRVRALYRPVEEVVAIADLESTLDERTVEIELAKSREVDRKAQMLDGARKYWGGKASNFITPFVFNGFTTFFYTGAGIGSSIIGDETSTSIYGILTGIFAGLFIYIGSEINLAKKHVQLLKTDPDRALVLYQRDRGLPFDSIKAGYQDWREQKGREWVENTDQMKVRAKLQSYINSEELSSTTIRRRVIPALSARWCGTRQLAVEVILKHDPQLEYQPQLEQCTRQYDQLSIPLAYQSFIQIFELASEETRREMIDHQILPEFHSSAMVHHQSAKNILRLLNGRANGVYTPLLEEARKRAASGEAVSKYAVDSPAWENYKGHP